MYISILNINYVCECVYVKKSLCVIFKQNKITQTTDSPSQLILDAIHRSIWGQNCQYEGLIHVQ